MDRDELAQRIRAASVLHGSFTLRSGRVSTTYWDKYRFESDPALLSAIGDALLELLPTSFDRLAGLELGGVPLATCLSLKTGKPCLYVRKAPKDYGTCNLVEGGFQSGDIAVVVEDVITSGGQVAASVREMRTLGLVVRDAVCVIDREQGGKENLEAVGCTVAALFTAAHLDQLAEETN